MRIEFTVTDEKGQIFIGAADLTPGKTSMPSKKVKTATQENSKNLPDYILDLRNAGFFKEPRCGAEVHSALQDQYHCQTDRVQMALLRPQRRKLLRKTKKVAEGREQVAYAW